MLYTPPDEFNEDQRLPGVKKPMPWSFIPKSLHAGLYLYWYDEAKREAR